MYPICRQYRFCGEYGSPRRGDRCPRSGASKPSTEKAPNEPKWGYPLMMVSQRVNIDAFGFANSKRTQFPAVRHERWSGADSSCLHSAKPQRRDAACAVFAEVEVL